MPGNYFKTGCKGCLFSQGKEILGGSALLPGGWSLNHYGGPEGYLGWMALQPIYHRLSLAELMQDELLHLGPNIAKIDGILSNYWRDVFKDPIERLYVVYFFESGGEFHLHVHLTRDSIASKHVSEHGKHRMQRSVQRFQQGIAAKQPTFRVRSAT